VRQLAAAAPAAEAAAVWARFNDAMWPSFWRRELDQEGGAVILTESDSNDTNITASIPKQCQPMAPYGSQ
jgi:hypothetical protein